MHLGWVRTNRADVIAWKRLGYAARASGPLTLYSSLLLLFVPHVSELGVRNSFSATLNAVRHTYRLRNQQSERRGLLPPVEILGDDWFNCSRRIKSRMAELLSKSGRERKENEFFSIDFLILKQYSVSMLHSFSSP